MYPSSAITVWPFDSLTCEPKRPASEAPSGVVVAMARRARELLEELFAARLHRAARETAAGEPRLIGVLLHHVDGADHARMLGTAVLRAEEVILPGLRRLEPDRAVPAGNRVGLHAEGGDVEIVDHVLGRKRHLDGPAKRNVERIDLARAVGVLEAPHPPLAGRVDFCRLTGGRTALK